MGNVPAGLAFVPETLGLVRTRLRNREYSSVRFCHREQHAILETSKPKMSAEGNVAAGPKNVGIKREDAMSPMLQAADGSLEFELVDIEEKPMMLGFGVGRFPSIGTRQNDVAEPD